MAVGKVLGEVMKLRKSVLKTVIKECLYEILTEDVQLRTTLVREALVDIVGGRNKIREVVQPRKQQTTEISRPSQKQQQRSRLPQKIVKAPKKDIDLFESIVIDTMEHTLPKQVSSDRKNPLSRSWSDAVQYDANQEEGPLTRLAQASRNNAGVVSRKQLIENDDIEDDVPGLEGISLSQLREAASSNSDSEVPETALDQLGLTQRDWNAHVESNGRSFDLASFANELEE